MKTSFSPSRSIVLCMSLLLAVSLAACGRDGGNRDSVPPTATPVQEPAQPAQPAPEQPEAPVEQADQPTPTPSPFSVLTTTRFAIQAVEGPDYLYHLVHRLPGQAQVRVTAQNSSGNWLRVDLDGTSAWIARWALEPQAGFRELPQASADVPQPSTLERGPMPDAPPPIEFGYGTQAHMIGVDVDHIMWATRDLGFNWLKQQIRWNITEPEQGSYNWRDLDLIVSRATYSDIDLLFSVVATPDWAREPDFDAAAEGPPANPQDLASFMSAMATRYCGTAVKAIEVWNEQNLYREWGQLPLNGADYVNLLIPTSQAIRAACPSMYVISGALTPAGNVPPQAVDDITYLEQMLANGLAGHVDAIGAHPSGYNVPANVRWQNACAAIVQSGNSFNGACDNPHHSWSFRSTMEGYRDKALQYGVDLPIWPTEFGWAAGGAYHEAYGFANDNDFDEQAHWTVEAFQMMKEWGWSGPAILWNMNFRVIADKTEQAQWGIVNNDWTPLPVYNALKAMEK